MIQLGYKIDQKHTRYPSYAHSSYLMHTRAIALPNHLYWIGATSIPNIQYPDTLFVIYINHTKIRETTTRVMTIVEKDRMNHNRYQMFFLTNVLNGR